MEIERLKGGCHPRLFCNRYRRRRRTSRELRTPAGMSRENCWTWLKIFTLISPGRLSGIPGNSESLMPNADNRRSPTISRGSEPACAVLVPSTLADDCRSCRNQIHPENFYKMSCAAPRLVLDTPGSGRRNVPCFGKCRGSTVVPSKTR